MSTKFNPQLVNWLKRTKASDTDSVAIYQFSHEREDSLYRELVLTCVSAGLLEYQEHDSDVIYYALTDAGKQALGKQEAGDGVIHFEQADGSIGAMRISEHTAPPAASEATVTDEPVQRKGVAHADIAKVDEWHTGLDTDGTAFVWGATVLNHYHYDARNEYHAESIELALNTYAETTATLRTETARLQSELEAARERVSELEGELIASREKYLESINKRHAELADYQAQVAEFKGQVSGLRERANEYLRQIAQATECLALADSTDEHSTRAYNILKGYSQAD